MPINDGDDDDDNDDDGCSSFYLFKQHFHCTKGKYTFMFPFSVSSAEAAQEDTSS